MSSIGGKFNGRRGSEAAFSEMRTRGATLDNKREEGVTCFREDPGFTAFAGIFILIFFFFLVSIIVRLGVKNPM